MELEKLIHAQCCTGLHSGLVQKVSSLFKVRSLLANKKEKKKETPVLASLHWLPVRFRNDLRPH